MMSVIWDFQKLTMCGKCPYSEFFWSVFSRIWAENEEIFRISPYSVQTQEQYVVRMRENSQS